MTTDRKFQWAGAALMALGVMSVCAGLAGGGIGPLLVNGLIGFVVGAIISIPPNTPRQS